MVCIHFSNQGLNLLLEYLARVDKLRKYENQIQIVIKRPYRYLQNINVKLELLNWNSNAKHKKTTTYN